MIGLLQPRAQSVSPMLFDNECGALIGLLGPLAVGHDLGEADPLIAAESQGRVRSCARELAIGFEGTDPSGVPGLLVVEVRCSWDIGRHPLMQPGDRLDMFLWHRPRPGADDISVIGFGTVARFGRIRSWIRR